MIVVNIFPKNIDLLNLITASCHRHHSSSLTAVRDVKMTLRASWKRPFRGYSIITPSLESWHGCHSKAKIYHLVFKWIWNLGAIIRTRGTCQSFKLTYHARTTCRPIYVPRSVLVRARTSYRGTCTYLGLFWYVHVP